MTCGRALAGWLVLLALAVINGFVRDFTYGPTMAAAHRVSTWSAIVLLGLAMAALTSRWPPRSGAAAWRLGAGWCAMTVVFELVLGVASGASWQRLLDQYDVRNGSLWPLLLAWIFVGPRLLLAVRHQPAAEGGLP